MPAGAATTRRLKDSFSAREKWKLWPWVLGNSLAGQTLGVSCMQWALENTRAGIVTAIIAMTPIVMLPMTRIFEGERISGARNGSAAASPCRGVIGLAFWR